MGLNSDNAPMFAKGDRVTAAAFREKLNQLSEGLRRGVLAPGSFQSGSLNLQRPVGGGGIGSHSQLIRGATTGEVSSDDAWFELTDLVPLEEFATTPAEPVKVYNQPRLFLSQGARVVAAYHQGAYTLSSSGFSGTLTTRTDDDTGIVTLSAADPDLYVGRTIDLAWSPSGSRTGMTITAVAGAAITVDGGTGDNLPATSTSIDITAADETVDWEAVFAERPYRSEFFILLAETIPAGTDTSPGILFPATPGIYIYTPTGYQLLTVDNIFGQAGQVGIYNPHPYAINAASGAGNTRFLAVEFQHVSIDGEDITYWFSLTSHDARAYAGWIAGDDQIHVHAANQMPSWEDASFFTGPQGPQGIQGPPGNDGADGADGDMVAEGYCTELDGANPKTIHHDAITTNAGTPATDRDLAKQQFWVHFAGAAARTDAKWKTCDLYDAGAVCQVAFSFSGVWEWATLQSYVVNQMQVFVNDNDDFDFKTITAYDAAKKQVFYHEAGTWKALDIPTTGIKLLGSNAGTLQFFDVADFVCP